LSVEYQSVTPDIVRMPTTAPKTRGMRIHTNANAADRRVILSMYFTTIREEMIVSLQAVSTPGIGKQR
jgi:hypothetical protein